MGPAPACTVALPIWLATPQVPLPASGSPQGLTSGILPTSPPGSTVLTRERYCCPSLRARLNVKEVLPPAFGFWFWVLCASANASGELHAPPLPLLSTVKLLTGVFAAVPL